MELLTVDSEAAFLSRLCVGRTENTVKDRGSKSAMKTTSRRARPPAPPTEGASCCWRSSVSYVTGTS